MTRVRISVTALLMFYACLQAFALPPDGFVSGDQGTKLLQTLPYPLLDAVPHSK